MFEDLMKSPLELLNKGCSLSEVAIQSLSSFRLVSLVMHL